MGTMVAVLSQKEMKLFNQDPDTRALSFVQKIENTDYSERNLEVTRHHPGVVQDGVSRSVMDAGTNPHDLIAEQFARKAVQFLDHEHKQGRLSELIVIAEPRFLGRIRSEMSEQLQKATARWIAKDLDKATTATLESALNSSASPT